VSGLADGEVIHAYGVTTAAADPALWPAGLGDAPVELLPIAGLSVLISRLPSREFGESAWDAHREDPHWLQSVAQQHHRVLQGAIESGDVVPLRLPGIYSDLAAVERAVTAEAPSLSALAQRLKAHVEVGVAAYITADASDRENAEPPSSGRDYLARRSAESERREEARLARNAALLDAHETLSALAASSVTRRPHDSALSGRREPMVLNAAHLVDRERFAAFIDEAERIAVALSSEGLLLEVSGPWPPYNFTSADSDDAEKT
jgi:hypothetical protein